LVRFLGAVSEEGLMSKQIAVVALVIALLPTSAFAQSIRTSIKTVVAAGAEQRPAARGRNPHKTKGLVLLAAGVGMVLLSALASETDCPIGQFGPECSTSANGPLLFGGLGVTGVGIFLMAKGAPSPQIKPGLGTSVVVGHKFTF